MKLTLRVVITLLVLTFSLGDVEKNKASKHVRIKRQDGYVYKRPSVAFELPTRPATPAPVSTQATVDRSTQAQQMYYAYSAPSGGSVNIGLSISGSTTSTTSSGGYSSGFNSGGDSSSTTLQSSGEAGYNYRSPTIGTQATNAGTVFTTVGTAVPSGTVGSQVTGYGTPSTTTATSGVTQAKAALASTSAPKYLPPVGIDESIVNIGGGGSPIGISPNVASTTPTSTQGSTKASPSDSYIPPVSMQPGSSTTSGSPSEAYLPPNSSPTATSSSYGTSSSPRLPSPTPQTPTAAYLPPIASQSPNQGTVSTPAVTYLPPVLK